MYSVEPTRLTATPDRHREVQKQMLASNNNNNNNNNNNSVKVPCL